MSSFNKKQLEKEILTLNKLVLDLQKTIKEKINKQIAKCVTLVSVQDKAKVCNGQANKKSSKRCSSKQERKGSKRPEYTLEDGQKTRLKDLRLPKGFSQVKAKA